MKAAWRGSGSIGEATGDDVPYQHAASWPIACGGDNGEKVAWLALPHSVHIPIPPRGWRRCRYAKRACNLAFLCAYAATGALPPFATVRTRRAAAT